MLILVGADRVCCNGDTANKISTCQLALSAKHHGIPFVAEPTPMLDLKLPDGSGIHIEERPAGEITHSPLTGQRVMVDCPQCPSGTPVST